MIDLRNKNIDLLIGGFHIRVTACSDELSLTSDVAWTPFINQCEQFPDITVKIHKSIPEWAVEATEIFEGLTTDNMGVFTDSKPWSIKSYQNKRVIVTGDQDYIALINDAGNEYDVYYDEKLQEVNEFQLFPYPLGPLLLYYIATSHGAVLLHSSGIFDGEKGRIFSGFSGVGKSTMAGLWQKSGARVVNDDRLLIRKIDGVFRMYNSPMFYMDVPKFAKIDSVYLLKQTPHHQIKPLSVIEAASRILGFCIQHAYDPDHMNNILNTVADLAASVGSYELGFALNPDVVDFVKQTR